MAVGEREQEDINWRDDYGSLFQVVLLEIGTIKWGNTHVGSRDQEKVFSLGEITLLLYNDTVWKMDDIIEGESLRQCSKRR